MHTLRNQHLGVDIGRVPLGASHIVVVVFPVNNHAQRLTHFLVLYLLRYAFLQVHKLLESLLFHLLWHIVVVVLCSKGAILLAVGKGAHTLKAHVASELHELLELLLPFSRETHHQRGAQVYARHLTAQCSNQVLLLSPGDVTLHGIEHLVAGMLQGNIEIVAHIVVCSHDRQQVVGELCGVGIMQSYPFHTRYIGHAVDELG